MKITRHQVLRAVPIVVTNLVPLAGAIAYGWPVAGLFVFYLLETWILVGIDAVRAAREPADGIFQRLDNAGRALIFLAIGTFFVAMQLGAAIAILAGKDFARQATGDIAQDLLRYVYSVNLAIPVAVIAIIHVVAYLREIAAARAANRHERTGGSTIMRFFVIIALFIVALGPTTLMGGNQSWALAVYVIIKTAFEVWYNDQEITWAMYVEKVERERREYQESLDPRGTGSWPTPPPKRPP